MTNQANISLDELERLLEAATPLPWELRGDGHEPEIVAPDGVDDPWNIAQTFACIEGTEDGANAALIVAAVNVLPSLIAAIRTLKDQPK